MPVYALDFDDISSNQYTLIGIHTTLNDFKLAYLLNDKLGFLFKRANYNLDIKNKNDVQTSFSVYEYHHVQYSCFLISNVSRTRKTPKNIGLFNENTVVNYLVPEKKKVDYFIKIEGDLEAAFLSNTNTQIKEISQIITSYQIEVDSLKSKDFLIF